MLAHTLYSYICLKFSITESIFLRKENSKTAIKSNMFLLHNIHKLLKIIFKSLIWRDFPGGPVVKTLSSQCRGHRFNPSPGN